MSEDCAGLRKNAIPARSRPFLQPHTPALAQREGKEASPRVQQRFYKGVENGCRVGKARGEISNSKAYAQISFFPSSIREASRRCDRSAVHPSISHLVG
jgi:hypothetical protein